MNCIMPVSTSHPSMLPIALAYRQAGRSVVPIAPGTKWPSLPIPSGQPVAIPWTAYQSTLADETTIQAWFPADRLMGIGIVCGPVSGMVIAGVRYGLEMLDVDDHATLEAFNETANFQGLSELIERLLHQRTPGGAGHYAFLCTQGAGNTKLAQRQTGVDGAGKPEIKTLIETRGHGGQAVSAPTPPGIHPQVPERGYELVRGDWTALPIITPDERHALLELSRSFNEYADSTLAVPRLAKALSVTGDRPGDWLNGTANGDWWRELLERHAWTLVHHRGTVQYWRRPGKDSPGWSATLGACAPYFYVFSSNAHPFEPGRAYTPFAALGLLHYGGDFSATARALMVEQVAATYPDTAALMPLLESQLSTPDVNGVFAAVPELAGLKHDTWRAVRRTLKAFLGNVLSLPKLEKAIKQARRGARTGAAPAPTVHGQSQEDDGPLPYSDFTNALALVWEHGHNFRYCYPWKSWLHWTGTHWTLEADGAIMRAAKATVKRLARQAEALDDDAAVSALLKHVKASLATNRLEAMAKSAQSELPIIVQPAQLDNQPWLLNTLNGTLDLRTGQLRPHDRADLLTKCIPVAFDASAPCPLWEAFLERVMTSNQSLISFLQRAVGYCLSGVIREHVLLIFWGTGRNGKSTFLNTLLSLLGPYAMKAPGELLMLSKHDRHPTERADLFGKRLVATLETEQGRYLAEVFVKEATGADPIRARRMHENFWEFLPTHKLVLATNHKPFISGTDNAIWERIRLVPWRVTIPAEERDTTLPEKLQAELPGILAWAVRGCLAWQAEGLGEPQEVKDATGLYRQDMDVLGAFLAECCLEGSAYRTKASVLYDTYKTWCQRCGEFPTVQRTWGMALTERGFERKRGTGGSYWWLGVGLPSTTLSDEEQEEEEVPIVNQVNQVNQFSV